MRGGTAAPWREVEHLILFSWSESARGKETDFEAAGRWILAQVPGVRCVAVGHALRGEALYQRAWFIRLASPAAEAAYIANATHLDYVGCIFRPHAGDRLKLNYLLE